MNICLQYIYSLIYTPSSFLPAILSNLQPKCCFSVDFLKLIMLQFKQPVYHDRITCQVINVFCAEKPSNAMFADGLLGAHVALHFHRHLINATFIISDTNFRIYWASRKIVCLILLHLYLPTPFVWAVVLKIKLKCQITFTLIMRRINELSWINSLSCIVCTKL